jgi:hypothetical protein
MNIIRLLRTARWLATSQIHRRFFTDATLDAARKRLRKLASAGYITKVQRERMTEALFTIGPEGKRTLERGSAQAVALERRPPNQLEHFGAVNDFRIAAELAGGLSYFFAYWELPGIGWDQTVIPDAIFALRERTFALEFDRGLEGVRYFITTKMTAYQRGFDRFPLSCILIVADRTPRMESLANAIGATNGRVLFSTLDLVRKHGLTAPIFYAAPGSSGVALV